MSAFANPARAEAWMCERCGTAKRPALWELTYCEQCYALHNYDEPLFVGTWDETNDRWQAICDERTTTPEASPVSALPVLSDANTEKP